MSNTNTPQLVTGSKKESLALGNFQVGLERLKEYIKSKNFKANPHKQRVSNAVQNPEIEVHNLGVIGHVDHGKSTTCARLCLENGVVSEREFEEATQRAAVAGMKSFSYAAILDESQTELIKGVTIGVSHKGFLTPKNKFFTLVDCPGHLDYIGNFSKGIGQTELALLVVDINTEFAKQGANLNTKQHMVIARASGVKSVIIVLTKVGLVPVAERAAKIKERTDQIMKFITKYPVSLPADRILAVAVDAIEGLNISDKSFNEKELPGYEGLSLLEALDQIKLDKPEEAERFVMPIDAAYGGENSGIKGTSCVITGRVISGKLKVGEEIFIKPVKDNNIKADVATGIETHHVKMENLKAGFNVGLSLRKSKKADIASNSCAYSLKDSSGKTLPHLKLAKQVTIRHARMINHPTELKVGSKMILHTACGPVPAKVSSIKEVYDLSKFRPTEKGFNLHIAEEYEKFKAQNGVGFVKEEAPTLSAYYVEEQITSHTEADKKVKMRTYYAIANVTLDLQKPVIVIPAKEEIVDNISKLKQNRLSMVFGRDAKYTILYGTVTDVKYDSSELL